LLIVFGKSSGTVSLGFWLYDSHHTIRMTASQLALFFLFAKDVDTHSGRHEAVKNKRPSLVVSESRSILRGSFISYSERTRRVLHVARCK